MATAPNERPKQERVVKLSPIRTKSSTLRAAALSSWKNAVQVGGHAQPRRKRPAKTATTSRFPRRRETHKKGNFPKTIQQKAPNLVAVIGAKPEIKIQAKAQVEERAKRKEEIEQTVQSRVPVDKASPKRVRGKWTRAIPSKKAGPPPLRQKSTATATSTSTTSTTGSGKSGWMSPLSKPRNQNQRSTPKSTPKNSKKSNWNKAYTDVASPRSGTQTSVAKQEILQRENKILSPKKRVRKRKPKIVPIPEVPLEEDENQHDAKARDFVQKNLIRVEEEESLVDASILDSVDEDDCFTKASVVSKPMLAIVPLGDMDDESEMDAGPRPITPLEAPPCGDTLNPVEEKTGDFEEYEEYDSDDSSDLEVASEQPPTPTAPSDAKKLSSAAPSGTQTPQKHHQQLVLEFSLTPQDGGKVDFSEAPGIVVPVELQSFDDLSSVGQWPSIASNDSEDTKMNKMMQRWVDVNATTTQCDEEERTTYDNAVHLEDNVLDHVVLAAPDLDEAMKQFEEMSGIKPNPVGPLQGLGARTAHVGLDNNRYVEIIAPDLKNPGPLGDELRDLAPGTLTPHYYCIRSSEVSRLIEGYVYDVLGWDPDHIAMVQALADDTMRQWDLLTMYGHFIGGCVPCYVKWSNPSQHPTATIALKSSLTYCRVRAPKLHEVHKLITGVEGLDVEFGDPLLEFVLSTPKGPLTFTATNPKGLVFPGFEDDHQITALPDSGKVPEQISYDDDWADVGYDSETTDTGTNDI